jgi:hypothetical protein
MKAEWLERGEQLVFVIQADRFLRNMVRAIVGTLLEVGRGKLDTAGFRAVIEQKDRCAAGASVEAKGLFLVDISIRSDFSTPTERLNYVVNQRVRTALFLGLYDGTKNGSPNNAVLRTLSEHRVVFPFFLPFLCSRFGGHSR